MKNRKSAPRLDLAATNDTRLRNDLDSPDAAIRARAVRSICPCHAGWEPFEEHRDAVARLTKDESPIVRARALHVFEEAAEMESSGLPTHRREATNEMLRTRRQSRFRRDADDEPHRMVCRARESRERLL